MKSKQGRRSAIRWFVRLQWHRLRFHVVRVGLRFPLGVWRVVEFLTRWPLDVGAGPMEQDLATAGKVSAKGFWRLREQRSARVKARCVLLLLALLPLTVAVTALVRSRRPVCRPPSW